MKAVPTTVDAYKLLHNGILALGRAERQGIRIDLDYCERTANELTARIRELTTKLENTKFYRHWKHSIRGRKPNIGSNQQLGKFLYGVKQLTPTKTTSKGFGSIDDEALRGLNIPELETLLEIRKLKKLRDTYLKGFMKEQVDGFLHPFFNLHIARTYRSSSNSPNFQNIPKRDEEAQKIVRQALYPRKGFQLLEVDYSGIEVSIAACYHKDPTMLKYIKDPSSDMHGDMAEQIFFLGELDKSLKGHKYLRSAAKNGFVFPQFYGDYYGNNAHDLAIKWGQLKDGRFKPGTGVDIDGTPLADLLIANGVKDFKQFTKHLEKIEKHFWGKRFKVYDKWKKKFYKQYLKRGYLEMKTGFRCLGPMKKNDVTNYPVQGAAFHCLLWSLTKLDKEMRKRKYQSRIIGQIHDAIVFDVHPDEVEELTLLIRKVMIDDLMEHWKWIIVPLEVEMDLGAVDASWNELEFYEPAA